MAVRINDDSMAVVINGVTLDTAERQGELWRVTGWPGC